MQGGASSPAHRGFPSLRQAAGLWTCSRGYRSCNPKGFFVVRPSVQHAIHRAAGGAALDDSHACTELHKSNIEEVRINKGTFDYLMAKNLWFVEGKAAFFRSGFTVNFPTNAREVKAAEVDAAAHRDGAGGVGGLPRCPSPFDPLCSHRPQHPLSRSPTRCES